MWFQPLVLGSAVAIVCGALLAMGPRKKAVSEDPAVEGDVQGDSAAEAKPNKRAAPKAAVSAAVSLRTVGAEERQI